MFTLFSDTVIDNIITEWQITESVERFNKNSNRTTSFKTGSEKIRKVIDHEEKVSSKGKETQFRRHDEKSEEIGRKYRIMKVLELEEASEMCQNLTAAFAKPNCSQANKTTTFEGRAK